MTYQNLAQMFFSQAEAHADLCGFRYQVAGRVVDVTYRQAAGRVRAMAAGILQLADVKPGDNISLVSNTRLEWPLLDYAIMSLGCRTVSVYASLLKEEVGYLHQDSQAKLAVVEDKGQLEKLRALKDGFRFFDVDYAGASIVVQKTIVIDPTGLDEADDWIGLAALEQLGRGALAETEAERQRRLDALMREHVATFVYTSGTTGPPKGVIQTHDNHLSILKAGHDTGFYDDEPVGGGFLFLPLAHSFGRLVEFGAAYHATPLILSSPETLLEDLKATRPDFFPAAPRVYEKIYAKIQAGLQSASPIKRALFGWSIKQGEAWARADEAGRKLSPLAAAKHRVADKLILSKVRAGLGLDRCKVMASGSAPLDPKIQWFFASLGLPIYEGYGLTETCPVLTTNTFKGRRTGTVGRPLTGVELRIAEDGEILAKGPNITPGYLNREDATAEAFDDDGWFLTGDIGEIDADGYLRITDRKKDLIKTSGGKYVAPQKIEGILKLHELVGDVVVIGDHRNYCVALIAVDPEALEGWAARTGNPASPQSDAVKAALQAAVDEVNAGLASFETIKKFRIVDEPFSVDNGMLTASFKVKRREVQKHYAALIDAMYAEKRAA